MSNIATESEGLFYFYKIFVIINLNFLFTIQLYRKTQRKIQELQKRLELSEIKEQTAVNILEKISQENEKLNLEKEAYQNLVTLKI